MEGRSAPWRRGAPEGGEVPTFRRPRVRATLALCAAALFFNLSRLLTPSSLFFPDDQFIAL